MSDIFISYNHEDRPRAQTLAETLEHRGWSTFWDRTIPTGKTWRETIGRELANARCVIVLWSKTSIESDWVQEEAEHAKQRGVLVPVLIEDVQPPIGFGSIQAAHLEDWGGTEPTPAFRRLIVDIAALIGPPPTEVENEGTQAKAEVEQAEEERNGAGAESEAKLKAEARRKGDEEAEARRKVEKEEKGECRSAQSLKRATPWRIIVGGVIILAVIAVVAVAVDLRSSREPLALSVEDNPARIGAFSDLPIDGMIPAEVRTTGSPGPGCDGFHDWLKRNSGVDAGSTKLQIAVQRKISKPILLYGIRVKILDRLPPVSGIAVTCPTAGQVKYRSIAIDLDAIPPRVKYQYGKESFGFTLQSDDTEAFTIVATTARQHYKWVVELDIVVEGTQRTIEIRTPSGAPFETTAKQSTESWEWDFENSWGAPVDTSRTGVPEKIPAGTPLPPLM